MLRDGAGGGKRVSAATAEAAVTMSDISAASDAMTAMGQSALYQVREADSSLDGMLAQMDFATVDPTVFYAAPTKHLTTHIPPRVSTFVMPEPLAIMREIWAAGGIGDERIAVMQRATLPKTTVLGRVSDRAVGAGFAAIHNDIAMIHALEVLPEFRRQGAARNMIAALAHWAASENARHVTLAVTARNDAANALYQSLGMTRLGGYHYRIKQPAETP